MNFKEETLFNKKFYSHYTTHSMVTENRSDNTMCVNLCMIPDYIENKANSLHLSASYLQYNFSDDCFLLS